MSPPPPPPPPPPSSSITPPPDPSVTLTCIVCQASFQRKRPPFSERVCCSRACGGKRRAPHGTLANWKLGCRCESCRAGKKNAATLARLERQERQLKRAKRAKLTPRLSRGPK